MGLFLHVILFPGGDEAACRAALEREALDPELSLRPGECRWQTYEKGPAVELNDWANGYETAGRLSGGPDGSGLEGPVLLAYIYDDDYWGYELWHKGQELDQFASVHDYFDEGSPPNKPGDAETVAQCFGVEPERIERYLIPWEDEDTGNYAYHADQAAAGDSWQMADFLNALGFDYDQLCPPPPETEETPNRPAPARPGPLEVLSLAWAQTRRAADAPVLPSALTDQAYTLQRAEVLGEDCADILSLLQRGKYQDLTSRLTEAIQATPEEAALYLIRAFCWKQLEGVSARSRTPDMLRDLTRALELEPDNVLALRGRAALTTTSRRYPQQIQDLTRLMELDGENRDLHQVSRAYFHHWLKDDAAAQADLAEVLNRGKLWTVDLVYLCRELHLPGF
ncbi:MAG: hypothetical protein HFG00_04135 [Oscillibacter sp.]|nr:hypothetical protein [Oscillibacter sp.]